MHPQDMWDIWQPIHDHWSLYHKTHLPRNDLVVWKSCRTLDHIFGGVYGLDKGITMCNFHPRNVRPFPCLHKTCKKYGNSSMETCASYHILHLHGEGMVVCRSWNLLLHLLWMVYDVPWAQTIHAYVDTPLNLLVCSCVKLVYHCIHNHIRGSHPYWPHNIQRIYHVWMDENWGTFIFCTGWCAMYHRLQLSIHVLTSLSIHQWINW